RSDRRLGEDGRGAGVGRGSLPHAGPARGTAKRIRPGRRGPQSDLFDRGRAAAFRLTQPPAPGAGILRGDGVVRLVGPDERVVPGKLLRERTSEIGPI